MVAFIFMIPFSFVIALVDTIKVKRAARPLIHLWTSRL